MTPSSAAALILSLAAGTAAGWVCFAGLWGTVRKFQNAHRPAAFYVASLFARLLLAAAVLTLAAIAGPGELVLCLLGFIAARLFVQTAVRKA